MEIRDRGLFRPQRKRQWISSALVVVLVLSLASSAFASTIQAEAPPTFSVATVKAVISELPKDATQLIERVRQAVADIQFPDIFAFKFDWPRPFVAARPNDRGSVKAQVAATTAAIPPSPVEAPTLSQSATTTTIIHQTINQPVVERIIQSPIEVAPIQAGVTEATLTTRLQDLVSAVNQNIQNAFIGAAQSARVESLSAITVSGVSGLTDADIPDDLTASNYLALTGGTLSGDLSITGNFTVSGAQTLSGAINIPYLVATSSTASSFVQASTTRFSVFDTAYFGGTATSTFDAAGNLSVAGTLGVTGKTTIGYASTTGITADYASTSVLVASNSFTLANLTGFLKATAGAVATALIDLANDVTGTLPVANGGTGWATFETGAIPYGNGSAALATTSAGTAGNVLALLNGVPTWTATTTLANISGTLGVGSGGTGATSFGQGWLYSAGGTNALAASTSPTVNYITATSTSATSTFAGGIVGPNNFVVQSSTGNVGIKNASPGYTLDVSGIIYGSGIQIGTEDTAPALSNVEGARIGTYLSINRSAGAAAQLGRTEDGAILLFYSAGNLEGTISVSGNTVTYGAFTGSHYAFVEGTPARGELVTLTGENIQTHEGRDDSEPIYGGRVSTEANDPHILGSYLALIEQTQPRSIENPELVMAVGNGFVWIVDNGEDVGIGDYLISSDTAGHAMKDPGTYDVSHVIARATDPVDWSTVTETIDGKKHKMISVTYELFDRNNTYAQILAALTASGTPSSTPQSRDFAADFFANLFARLTKWFADTGNGIVRFFAKQVRTEELCIGSTCVTEVELKALLDREPVTNFSAPAPASLPRETSTRELPGDALEEATVAADVPELTDVPSIIPDDLNGEDIAPEDSDQPQNADAAEHSSDGPQAEAVDSHITESASATADTHGNLADEADPLNSESDVTDTSDEVVEEAVEDTNQTPPADEEVAEDQDVPPAAAIAPQEEPIAE